MQQRDTDQLPLKVPAAVATLLAESIKAKRAALVQLEPWMQAQPPSPDRVRYLRQLRYWQAQVNADEQIVLAATA
jgi:hypothetical protein